MTPVLEVLHEAATAAAAALKGLDDWGHSGARPDQYHSDVVADAAVLEVIDRAGFGAFSEESGVHNPDRPIRVVVDPVDGSTNACRGLPWWATSLCAVDADGPLAAVVVNQATGTWFTAERGAGAFCDGEAIAPSGARTLTESIVAFSGYPRRYIGWNQYRSLGAAALDLCAVAAGILDAFIDCAGHSLAPWDYLGGLLICTEAGASVVDLDRRDLIVIEGRERRTVIAAATPDLLADALEGRRKISE